MRAAGYARPVDLASALGVHRSVVSRWVAGTGVPELERLRSLAPLLGRPTLELTVAAGYLTSEEANMREAPKAVQYPGQNLDPKLLRALEAADEQTLNVVRAVLRSMSAR